MEREIPVVFTEIATAKPARERGSLRLLLTVIRPHQWVKNLFVLAPLLFGRRLTDVTALADATLGFAAFCLLSSAVYIFNDWWDAEDDKAHPEKRNRPLSSGALSASLALSVGALLVISGIGVGLIVGQGFAAICVLYAVLMVAYCIWLKRAIVLDAMTIASGFVLRVLAGAVAVGVSATHWLIACTFLLALFLAFSKRRQELLTLEDGATDHREVLSHYTVRYLDSVINIVIGASIVCYALYTVAPETVARFGTDALVYGTGFVLYGMLRYLALINDPSKGGNPSKLLLTDLPLLLTLAGWAAYNISVIYRHVLYETLAKIS
ncbi:MAG TPA: decaprenyl-phosphate phosphoribosyltransferase [Pyrinomonadaceae bacterium]